MKTLLFTIIFCFFLILSSCSKKEPHISSFEKKERTIQLRERALPLRHNECHNCHLKKYKFFIPEVKEDRREHSHISLQHGNLNISCNHCHDANNSNYLRAATFENSSPVCDRCHSERLKEWREGFHGKRQGGWNVSEVIQWHCIDCHDPHAVRFKKMEAKPKPLRPKRPHPNFNRALEKFPLK